MNETVKLSPEEEAARKRRNVIIALSVVAFVALVFVITLVQMKANILDRPL